MKRKNIWFKLVTMLLIIDFGYLLTTLYTSNDSKFFILDKIIIVLALYFFMLKNKQDINGEMEITAYSNIVKNYIVKYMIPANIISIIIYFSLSLMEFNNHIGLYRFDFIGITTILITSMIALMYNLMTNSKPDFRVILKIILICFVVCYGHYQFNSYLFVPLLFTLYTTIETSSIILVIFFNLGVTCLINSLQLIIIIILCNKLISWNQNQVFTTNYNQTSDIFNA